MATLTLQEDYALNPGSRAKLVEDLTPNTEEYYLYRLQYLSLQLQTGEIAVTAKVLEEAQALLDAARNSGVVQDSQALERLATQFAVLAYPIKPDPLLKCLQLSPDIIQHIKENEGGEVGSDIHDDNEVVVVEISNQESPGIENLSSEMDPSLVSTETMTKTLLDRMEKHAYQANVHREAWPYFLTQPRFESIIDGLRIEQLAYVFQSLNYHRLFSPTSLEIVNQADPTRIDLFFAKIMLRLYREKRLDFAETHYQISQLTRVQLDWLQKEEAKLIDDEAFVGLLENRIVPEPFATDKDAATKAWLDKMIQFVDGLSPKFERYKVSVYLLSLEYDLRKGTLDKAKFLKYIVLSRSQSLRDKKNGEDKISVFHQPSSNADFWVLNHWSSRVPPATTDRHDEIETEYLTYFIRQAKSATEFEPYFEVGDFLNPLLARTMLASGDKDLTKWSNMLSKHDNLSKLSKQTILKFAPDNLTQFLPSDPVVFKLRAKNAPKILVRVFEVKTFEYLQQYGNYGVIGENLNLDGLTPNWEHSLVHEYPALEVHDIIIELPELLNKRGAFVMDVISNGESSSAYFTKGYLDFVERQSVAGHVLTIIDEKQQKLTGKTNVWVDGHYYDPNGDGDIIVPYRRPTSGTDGTIYLIHDGFATSRSFTHRIEQYNLQLACHIDHESLVAGAYSKIVLKPTVQINNTVNVPVNLLEQVELTVDYTDTNHISSKTTVPDFKIHDVDWSEYNFQVPENMANLSITLSAKIKAICSDEIQNLTVYKCFEFERPIPDKSVTFYAKGSSGSSRVTGELLTVLRKSVDGYRVLALGMNGERRANIPLLFTITHPIFETSTEVYLRTDSTGQVFLGQLKDIESVFCNTTVMTWDIGKKEHLVYPATINSIEGEVVSIPLARNDVETIRKISLFSKTSAADISPITSTVLDDCTKNIHYNDGLLSVKGLKAGYYVFTIEIDTRINIVVASSKTPRSQIQGLEDFIIGSNPMLEVLESTRQPLYISPSITQNEQSQIDIQLRNWSPETRVCVFITKFIPYDAGALYNLNSFEPEKSWSMDKTEMTLSAYKIGRVLGEEYQYVMYRKTHSVRWAGNLLSKPSNLLTPWVVADTTQSKEIMQDGTEVSTTLAHPILGGAVAVGSACCPAGQSARMKTGRRFSSRRAPPTFNFLASPSVSLVNMTPNLSTGVVSVPFSAFKEGSFLQVIVSDGHQILEKSIEVINRPSTSASFEFQKRDLRFKSLLDYAGHYIGEQTGVDLDPKASAGGLKSITLSSNGSSSSAIRVINSLSQVYDLMLTLIDAAQRQMLQNFGFIVDWERLSSDTKKAKYSKWNCHELNLFLYKKDKSFFDTVVAPFLKNKLMRSFMDDYLIGASLDKYASLDVFNQLTCMEKCLLAQRLPDLKPAVIRWLKDRIHQARPANYVKLFQTIMNSGNMKEAEEAKEESDDDMGFGFEHDIIVEKARSAQIMKKQFKPVDLTKEMAETYYYGRQDIRKDSYADKPNLFWLDLVQWDESKGSFLSQNFVVNTQCFTDAMATLALLDVTFRPKDASVARSADQNLVVTSQTPAIVFHSSTKAVYEPHVAGAVLVTQQYFDQCEKTAYDEVLMTQVRRYIPPDQEFRPLVSYGAHVVIMNGTPTPMKVHLDVQIPQGSISIYRSLESGQDIQLNPHATFQYEYGFYFPEAGDFPHYPAHLSNYKDIIAFAPPHILRVRDPTPNRQETVTTTWPYIIENGSCDDIVAKLESSPIESLPVSLLVPRLYKDRQLLKRVTSVLRVRKEYEEQIWRAGFVAKNEELIKEYLTNLSAPYFKVGDWFTSNLFTCRPYWRFDGSWHDDSFKYLEYFPLINSRTHKASKTAEILNDKFRQQYKRFLRLLSEKPNHDINDLLALLVYLLAQDRIQEAKDRFKELHNLMEKSKNVYFQQLQYDYLQAYLSLCVEVPTTNGESESILGLDLVKIQGTLDKYKDHPVERWNKMFKDMQIYIDDINKSLLVYDSASGADITTTDDATSDANNTDTEEIDGDESTFDVPVTVDFKVGTENVMMVRHRGVREVTVEYYAIDAEAMFSASPLTFADQGEVTESTNSSRNGDPSNSYRLVKPNGIDTHTVKRATATDGLLMIPILPQYLNTNVMISVRTTPPAANRVWKTYYSQTIVVQCLELTGTIKVISKPPSSAKTKEAGRPIRGGYVKVYAEMKDNSTAFWKDGYTDLVGRFAYAQVSTGASTGTNGGGGIADVKRFVAFVDGGCEGCVVQTLPVPPV
ncbi:hypothetical protein FBU30_000540 [Linnemannia zychae]|nr:hypothetical protein FBU30_000540 [Linnemannia zychae]